MVSSLKSIPPPKKISLLSNSSSLYLSPTTGWSKHPLPFPPVNETDKIWSTSKSCGSTKTAVTIPLITGTTNAVVPILGEDIVIFGGFITS